ncbi:glutaminyl-peptide cyclotransferase like protein [Babesia gibsoni]|uniref:Glutaminyl-peptide cyclotransferase like protein n=1 Tax=Babesia gibsoni TaxID=33632 RepID=A0AAD8P849_BABGI|nr:glutaminyl-peptide cyclotransferase like protein [Babesia gibsoni]
MPRAIPHFCNIGGHNVIPFTQGILFTGENRALESSGLSEESFIREFNVNTGETIRYVMLNPGHFAEGCAIVVEPSSLALYVMVLTYKNELVLLYDYATFELRHMFTIGTMGFGLTSNYDFRKVITKDFVAQQKVWMTTGDERLVSLVIPESFSKGAVTMGDAITITMNQRPLAHVNELEYVHQSDTIYANIWLTNYIVEIDYRTGECVNMWDLSSIASLQPHYVDVLNGIASNPSNDALLITGKHWPYMYFVKLYKRESTVPRYTEALTDRIMREKNSIKH